jgi:carbon dioxide concentrating mechanism protein CcmN
MYLPRLELIANAEVRVIGDVKIHPSAVIAKGTILEAAPGSQIVIGADVCIGIGTIITACEGSIEIESGVILGAEVLIFGNCQIGRNACIGSSTTIFNISVEAMQVISSGSLLGDISRAVALDNCARSQKLEDIDESTLAENLESETVSSTISEVPTSTSNKLDEEESFWFDPEPSDPEKTEEREPEKQKAIDNGKVSNSKSLNQLESKTLETGQVYINQLLVTLFPHGRDFNQNRSKDSK